MLSAAPDRRLYACSDGRYVAVASAEPRTWGALCEGLGVPELKDSLHKADQAQSTTEILAKIFLTQPATEWVARLAPLGAAVTVMNHAAEVLEDPQVRARASVVESGGVPVPASPIRLSSADGGQTSTATEAPHTIGEDTDDVLSSAGFTETERRTLAEAGII
jgi:crotonobetainyl-CoA:carnitine CoA-transferase CaiB-like acyl-CoA transferase